MSVLLSAVSLLLLQRLLTVSMVTGALFDDSCVIDDSLSSTGSLSLSTSESSYVSGQKLTGWFTIDLVSDIAIFVLKRDDKLQLTITIDH